MYKVFLDCDETKSVEVPQEIVSISFFKRVFDTNLYVLSITEKDPILNYINIKHKMSCKNWHFYAKIDNDCFMFKKKTNLMLH